MGNVIFDMRNAMDTANKQLRDIRLRIDGNNQRYSKFVAEQENKKLFDQAETICARARQTIAARHKQEIDAVKQWGQLRGDDLDGDQVRDDLRLLSSGLKLTGADIARLMVKHQGNYSMVQLIKQYADEKGVACCYVPNVDDKTAYLDELRKSAEYKLGKMRREMGIDPFYIEMWANPAGMGLTAEASRAILGLTVDNCGADGVE